ncbi:MAG: polymer-forming cytoskeletal protein [Acidobacteria bacterium]|nr:polymer-forming cytoskeletal protein [Acidobacteriota bacterium]
MWKRDESLRSLAETDSDDDDDIITRRTPANRKDDDGMRVTERVNIGKSVVIKGELNGSEDLTVEGKVEGKIELRQHVLTIGPHGKIKAQVFAKSVVVLGEVNGNVTASDKVSIRENGSVDGDITAPRVAIAEGAHFRGSVDMQRAEASPSSSSSSSSPPPAVAVKKGQGGGGRSSGAAAQQAASGANR